MAFPVFSPQNQTGSRKIREPQNIKSKTGFRLVETAFLSGYQHPQVLPMLLLLLLPQQHSKIRIHSQEPLSPQIAQPINPPQPLTYVEFTATDGTEVKITDKAQLTPYLTKNMVYLESILPGTELLVWKDSQGSVIKAMLFAYDYRGYLSVSEEAVSVNGAVVGKTRAGEDGDVLLPIRAVAEALGERGDDQLLDVCRFADGEAAASALVDGEVMGVFSVDEDGEPVLSLAPGLQIGQTTDMDAIDRSILESVVGTYVRDADLMTSIARENPGAFADLGRLEALFSSVDATEEVSLTHAAPKESVRFYYALFAMAALFGAQIAVVAVCWTQPNLSPLGARRALGAIGRTRTLLATLLACWLLSFCCLLIAFLYTRLVVGVDFAGREGLCVAGLGAASLLACALGTALGSLPKLDVGSKTGILTGVVCLLSLFTGLYGEPCMELADMVSREFPVLASLNPAKAICDMFYSLYYYDGLEVFAGNVALIGLFSAALFAVGALFVRRQRYASL